MDSHPIYNDLSLLHARREEIKDKVKDLQAELKVISNTLIDMFDDAAHKMLAEQGKDFGQVTIKDGDFSITYDKRKKVDWDQEQLTRVLDLMDHDTASHYAKVTISIPEVKYQAAPPDIKSALSTARTVNIQSVQIDIKKEN